MGELQKNGYNGSRGCKRVKMRRLSDMKTLIKYLLKEDTVIFFDVDGVLAPYEFGENRHCIDDAEWDRKMENGEDMYSTVAPVKLFQQFISQKGIDNVYVCSKANPEEYESKMKFCHDGYGIPMDHIIMVSSKNDKLAILKAFAEANSIPENKIAMVEDTTKTLDMIAKGSKCSTIHVSSFLDYSQEE